MNLLDWILTALLTGAAAAAVITVLRKRGKGCGGDCSGCAFSAECRKKHQ